MTYVHACKRTVSDHHELIIHVRLRMSTLHTNLCATYVLPLEACQYHLNSTNLCCQACLSTTGVPVGRRYCNQLVGGIKCSQSMHIVGLDPREVKQNTEAQYTCQVNR